MQKEIDEFLRESNAIEQEHSEEAFEDAKKAWEYAYEYRTTLTIGGVLMIHERLMKRLNPLIAGMLRKHTVRVGNSIISYISSEHFGLEIIDILHDIKYTNNAKENHIKFEHLHPFEDGNGRVGRILYNIHRFNLGLPIHIIHEGKEQMEYYNWFKGGNNAKRNDATAD